MKPEDLSMQQAMELVDILVDCNAEGITKYGAARNCSISNKTALMVWFNITAEILHPILLDPDYAMDIERMPEMLKLHARTRQAADSGEPFSADTILKEILKTNPDLKVSIIEQTGGDDVRGKR